jgi:hypothetical protein
VTEAGNGQFRPEFLLICSIGKLEKCQRALVGQAKKAMTVGALFAK